MLTALLGLNTEELRALAQEQGGPAYRGNQLAEWLYQRGARTLEEMTSLPHPLRARLAEKYEVGRSQIVAVQHSRDGTVKLLLAMHDGAKVETVGLPYADRFSCCISTQVGCPIRCVFCATGIGGYVRNLTAGEIVGQVLEVQEVVRNQQSQVESRQIHSPSSSQGEGDTGGEVDKQPLSRRIDHVTFMGMGEPLLNYEATVKAIRLLNKEFGIAMRHLTVSTVGFVPGIRRLAKEKLQITLAVSLHSPTDALRQQLIPGMSKWGVAEIVAACREYVQQTGRRLTFEYCLLHGVNDGMAEAQELARVLSGPNCHVNLIPYNPVSGSNFYAPSRKRLQNFREILESAGITVTQRVQRGSDIDAACGQLRQRTTGGAPARLSP